MKPKKNKSRNFFKTDVKSSGDKNFENEDDEWEDVSEEQTNEIESLETDSDEKTSVQSSKLEDSIDQCTGDIKSDEVNELSTDEEDDKQFGSQLFPKGFLNDGIKHGTASVFQIPKTLTEKPNKKSTKKSSKQIDDEMQELSEDSDEAHSDQSSASS